MIRRKSKKPLPERLVKKRIEKQEQVDKITRIIAIIVAFASVYYFFIKLLFL
jgi:hypothetical protein